MMKKLLFISLALLLVILLCKVEQVNAQGRIKNASLDNWPKGCSPKEVGKRVAEHFVNSPHQNSNGRKGAPSKVLYPEVCCWYGALTFAKESNDKVLLSELAKRFEPLFGADAKLIPEPLNVDYAVFGSIPLELYILTKDKRYLDLGIPIADKQWSPPDSSKVKPQAWQFYKRGYSWHTRLWVDDMFMITALQTMAYRATGDRKYIDRTAKEMVLYLDSVQQPNGLFYHAPDVPFFWGRGNGWFAAGMTELLRSLPKNHPDRERIMKGYKIMMASLLKYQTKEGMWRQLIDDPESWPETSCTGMFTFAMISGVKNGWLDKDTYGPAARKAWLSLVTYLDENNNIREVCEGTNKKNDRQYYLDRKRITGDMHGQAPVLWCATALLRK